MSTAVLLDTDIGSDIDDAVALAYLLRQPACELVGITTVSGDTDQRAGLADVICRAAGVQDVPIHRGASKPLVPGPEQPAVPQYAAVSHLPHDLGRPADTAVDFMRETIRARPGEITLLTIGPLTNTGLLFALDPEIPALLAGFVSMAGWFTKDRPEWNAFLDATASSIAYDRAPDGHVSIGLDVTLRCQLEADDVRKRFTQPPLDVVRDAAEVWFGHRPEITFHDPLAAVTLFESDVVTLEAGTVTIERHAPPGRTIFAPGPGPHRVATDVDVDAFFERYFAVFA